MHNNAVYRFTPQAINLRSCTSSISGQISSLLLLLIGTYQCMFKLQTTWFKEIKEKVLSVLTLHSHKTSLHKNTDNQIAISGYMVLSCLTERNRGSWNACRHLILALCLSEWRIVLHERICSSRAVDSSVDLTRSSVSVWGHRECFTSACILQWPKSEN